jgi:hypothetical protein
MWQLSRFAGKRISEYFAEFGFADFSGYWKTRLSSDFGEFVWARKAGFSLRIFEIGKSYRAKNWCLMC